MSSDDLGQSDPRFVTQLRELAESAARIGGDLARASFGRTHAVTLKADRSEVTEIDLAAEQAIVAHLSHRRPEDAFIGEEAVGQRSGGTGAREHKGRAAGDEQTPAADRDRQSSTVDPRSICWVIDPIDGTRNYVRGVPPFTCSVAAMRGGRPVAGAVYDPIHEVMYSAAAGVGIRVAGRFVEPAGAPFQRATTRSAKLLVGIPSARRRVTQRFVHHAVQQHVIRNFGSAALHLALAATGVLDVVVTGNGKLWDIAAGALLVTEAEGVVTTPEGGPVFPLDLSDYVGAEVPLIAGRPAAHARLLREVGPH